MKLIKFTSILLCIVLLVSVLAGCNALNGSKTDVSKSNTGENASVIPEEVSPQESEVLEKIEPWGTDEDWDFLKGWALHSDSIGGAYSNDWPDYPNYSPAFKDIVDVHSKYEVLIHMIMYAYYADKYDESTLTTETKFDFANEDEIRNWLEAGNIPLEIQTFSVRGAEDGVRVFCGYLSGADVEKLIEYGAQKGYYVKFELVPSDDGAMKEEGLFDCPLCNSMKSN